MIYTEQTYIKIQNYQVIAMKNKFFSEETSIFFNIFSHILLNKQKPEHKNEQIHFVFHSACTIFVYYLFRNDYER